MNPLLSPTRSTRVRPRARAGLIAVALAATSAVMWSPASTNAGSASDQPEVADPTLFTTIFEDNFNRGSGELAAPWVESPNLDWELVNDQVAVVGGGGEGVALVETGKSDVSVQATITLSPVSSEGTLSVRAVDAQTQLLAGLVLNVSQTENRVALFKRTGGAYEQLDQETNAGLTVSGEYIVRVDAMGADIRVYIDNVERLAYTLTPAEMTTFGANTQHGLRALAAADQEDGGSRWDDFIVRDLNDPIVDPPSGDDWFVPLSPARFLDTRSATGTFDAGNVVAGPVAAGSTTKVNVRSRGMVPANATAVVLNVTAVGPAADGFATVFPCDEAVPVASNLNYQVGDDIPNAVIAKIAADGSVCIFTDKATHLLADVNGYFI